MHSVERPSSRSASRWFGTMSCVRANQKPERPVSTRPLSGISVGRTTSKTEMRSLATSSKRSSSSSYSSRTFPLATWTVVSDMNGRLLRLEVAEPFEDGVHVTDGGIQVEDRVHVDAARDRAVGADELLEVLFLLPRAHRVGLDETVGLVPRHARLDQREQQLVAEDEAVASLEVAPHPLRIDDEPLDDPAEAVEHVVEGE